MILQQKQRSGYTLIELLVVILIISILVSLFLAAVNKITEKIQEVQARTEISEMAVALRAFMTDYQLSEPPPSFLVLHEDGQYNMVPCMVSGQPLATADMLTVQFLQKCFGRNFNPFAPRDWNGNGTIDPPYTMEGQQCLVFYLGGIPTYSPQGLAGMTGFSSNNMLPNAVAATNTTRKGPYFAFDNKRLQVQGGFPVYLDAYLVKANPKPYAYFSAQGNYAGYNTPQRTVACTVLNSNGDCSSIGACCYQMSVTNAGVQYTNINTFQLLSAGRDGVFGYDTAPQALGSVQWSPYGGLAGTGLNSAGIPAGKDDQANFSSTKLGIGQN